MKYELFDGPFGIQITMTPETIEETGILLRASANAKKVPVEMYYSFPEPTPHQFAPPKPRVPFCNIWIKKVDPKNQTNSVNNKNQKKQP